MSREKAFVFFQNPKNLFDITPDWADFRIDVHQAVETVFEGAEYYYHIRLLGLRLKLRSKIQTFKSPYDFTDIQMVGPYTKLSILTIFKEQGWNTRMSDIAVYRLPFSSFGRAVHRL